MLTLRWCSHEHSMMLKNTHLFSKQGSYLPPSARCEHNMPRLQDVVPVETVQLIHVLATMACRKQNKNALSTTTNITFCDK